jgi:hypothetical protein
MSTTERSDLILPSILAQEFSKGIAGMEVLQGSGIFTVNPGLQAGGTEVGNDVTVPYFDSIGKAQSLAVGAALTPKKLSMSSETGTVVHLGDAVSVGGWAAKAKVTVLADEGDVPALVELVVTEFRVVNQDQRVAAARAKREREEAVRQAHRRQQELERAQVELRRVKKRVRQLRKGR